MVVHIILASASGGVFVEVAREIPSDHIIAVSRADVTSCPFIRTLSVPHSKTLNWLVGA